MKVSIISYAHAEVSKQVCTFRPPVLTKLSIKTFGYGNLFYSFCFSYCMFPSDNQPRLEFLCQITVVCEVILKTQEKATDGPSVFAVVRVQKGFSFGTCKVAEHSRTSKLNMQLPRQLQAECCLSPWTCHLHLLLESAQDQQYHCFLKHFTGMHLRKNGVDCQKELKSSYQPTFFSIIFALHLQQWIFKICGLCRAL